MAPGVDARKAPDDRVWSKEMFDLGRNLVVKPAKTLLLHSRFDCGLNVCIKGGNVVRRTQNWNLSLFAWVDQ